jgi:hypothetical protein
MSTPHLSCKQGTKVRIQLKNKIVIIDRFKEKKGNYIILYNRRVRKNLIDTFSIIKGVTL